ncbi:hypothetical protein QBC34DRAFT_119654 [Podospora aff. communis PSN243]|uniref:Uncharacterized protein n=1 Tax=Podospora aff. communis PSN243 TaxID=3040156 RepID=A0AAV9GL47_9PEZI|nr:hypothetical protein QBC34DRAFT_119654 [Podospora aff. communis PSN243]
MQARVECKQKRKARQDPALAAHGTTMHATLEQEWAEGPNYSDRLPNIRQSSPARPCRGAPELQKRGEKRGGFKSHEATRGVMSGHPGLIYRLNGTDALGKCNLFRKRTGNRLTGPPDNQQEDEPGSERRIAGRREHEKMKCATIRGSPLGEPAVFPQEPCCPLLSPGPPAQAETMAELAFRRDISVLLRQSADWPLSPFRRAARVPQLCGLHVFLTPAYCEATAWEEAARTLLARRFAWCLASCDAMHRDGCPLSIGPAKTLHPTVRARGE